MKKKIILTIFTLLILTIAIITYFVLRDISYERKLKNEISQITELTKDWQNFNKEQFEEKINRTITKKDYALVEKSAKKYLKDSVNNMLEITNILENENITKILTADNYNNDGPDFTNTKNYLLDTKNKLTTGLDNYYKYLTKDVIISYLHPSLDKYYKNFYLNELIGDYEKEFNDKTIDTSIKNLLTLLDNSEKIIDFLIENKTSWYVKDGNIVFKTNDLLNTYNTLVDNL